MDYQRYLDGHGSRLNHLEEVASYNGNMIWKISDLTRRKQDADSEKALSFCSPTFYTSRYGYKMCARIYLNGDGLGKGTHVSIYLVTMQGNWDAILPWPFHPKVTFCLMDQNNGTRHLSDICYWPMSGRRPAPENTIHTGSPLFVYQSVLKDSSYVNDDEIFIKVHVDYVEVEDVVWPMTLSQSVQEIGMDGLSDANNARMNTGGNQIGVFGALLAEHHRRLHVLETTNYEGVLVWKIEDVAQWKADAHSGKTVARYSQPFYTSRYGYKMCAKIYLNGDGRGNGTHVSLFLVMMRGEYDVLLQWPFKQKVMVFLMGQDGRGHQSPSDSFRPDPKSSSFQQPTEEFNIASGCPLFVNQSFLRDPNYVKDDVAFIKVIVDTEGLLEPGS